MNSGKPVYQWKKYYSFWLSISGLNTYSICEWLRKKQAEYGCNWEFKAVRSNTREDVYGAATDNAEVAALFKLTYADKLLTYDQIM